METMESIGAWQAENSPISATVAGQGATLHQLEADLRIMLSLFFAVGGETVLEAGASLDQRLIDMAFAESIEANPYAASLWSKMSSSEIAVSRELNADLPIISDEVRVLNRQYHVFGSQLGAIDHAVADYEKDLEEQLASCGQSASVDGDWKREFFSRGLHLAHIEGVMEGRLENDLSALIVV
jgi:hypothetical protein